jgi:sodium/bile acid cotransporter 7
MSTTTTTQVVHDTHAVEMTTSRSGTPASTLKSDHASIYNASDEPQKPTAAPAPETRWTKVKKTSWALFVKYWFLIGLGFVIGLAFAIPWVGKSYGSIQAQYTVKWGAVIVIFLLSGLGLDVKVMFRTILRWRLHLYVQVVSFLVLPFLGWGVVRFFIAVGANIDEMVYQGWIIALSTSTTVSSNSVMTRNANGNDSAGKQNAIIRNDNKDLCVFRLVTLTV